MVQGFVIVKFPVGLERNTKRRGAGVSGEPAYVLRYRKQQSAKKFLRLTRKTRAGADCASRGAVARQRPPRPVHRGGAHTWAFADSLCIGGTVWDMRCTSSAGEPWLASNSKLSCVSDTVTLCAKPDILSLRQSQRWKPFAVVSSHQLQ